MNVLICRFSSDVYFSCMCMHVYVQIYKKALTRQRILHPEEVSQLFPSLEDLVALHGSLLVNLKDRVATSKDELVTHISDVLLQAVSLYVHNVHAYVCMTVCTHIRNYVMFILLLCSLLNKMVRN